MPRFRFPLVALLALFALVATGSAASARAKHRRPAKPTAPPVVTSSPERGPMGAPGGHVVLKPVSGRGLSQGKSRAAGTSALILYDGTGPYAWLGQAYGTMVANLASHFGSWTAKPIAQYAAGDVDRYTATIYIGSTYDEPVPAAFLTDVPKSTRPVVWVYDNIWELTAKDPAAFKAQYGWMWSSFSSCTGCAGNNSPVSSVEYKGQSLSRSTLNQAGIMDYSAVDSAKATVLATAKRADGTSFPWAIRSGNLTYVGENPFSYFNEGDRMMAFSDLLFDALAPQTAERHRALVRLEDINPESDPAELRAVGDYLASRNVPFSFGVSPVFKDPLNATESPATVTLKQRPALVSALKYLQSKGGTLVDHGYTHQLSNLPNPYNGVSGDDFEFYRVTENSDHSLNFQGPVGGDSQSWAAGRMDSAIKELDKAGFARPSIFEFPHYSGSVADYKAAATRFASRYERVLYPLGAMTGGTPDYTRVTGQLFPFAVRDVYGQRVIPENLGNIEPEPFYQYPTRSAAQILTDAQRNLVVRDGVGSFYFHPFWSISYLKDVVEGMQGMGYTFVSPDQV